MVWGRGGGFPKKKGGTKGMDLAAHENDCVTSNVPI